MSFTNRKQITQDEEDRFKAAHEEFMAKLPDDIKSAAEHTINNREELEKSKNVGCYYCLSIYKPAQIWEWIHEGSPNEFPMCPKCGIDSVFGDASGYPVTRKFLSEMNTYWFDGDGELISESIANYKRDNELDDLSLTATAEGVRVFINDKDLIDLLQDYEKPFAEKEDPSPDPGGYTIVPLEDFLKNGHVSDSDDDLVLLRCSDCGEIGCWPMVVRVKRSNDKVIWSHFQQPHRDASSHNFWDYSNFGPFRFDAVQYERILESLTNHLQTKKPYST